jgi:hypothetical protein
MRYIIIIFGLLFINQVSAQNWVAVMSQDVTLTPGGDGDVMMNIVKIEQELEATVTYSIAKC